MSDAFAFPKSWQSIDLTHCDVLVIACPIDGRGHLSRTQGDSAMVLSVLYA